MQQGPGAGVDGGQAAAGQRGGQRPGQGGVLRDDQGVAGLAIGIGCGADGGAGRAGLVEDGAEAGIGPTGRALPGLGGADDHRDQGVE